MLVFKYWMKSKMNIYTKHRKISLLFWQKMPFLEFQTNYIGKN